MDISKTIAPKSDQLNADDLIGKTKIIVITEVKGNNDPQQPISIHFEGDNKKPYKPCKSMRRVMVQLWGADASLYAGRSLMLYRDDSVLFAGVEVGGIRISHASHIEAPTKVLLTMSKSKRMPVIIQPLGNYVAPKKEDIDPSSFIDALNKATDLAELSKVWSEIPKEIKTIQAVLEAKDLNKSKLSQNG